MRGVRNNLQLPLFNVDPKSNPQIYYFLLQPLEPIYTHVKNLRAKLEHHLNLNSNENYEPRLYLLQFQMPADKEEDLVKASEEILKSIRPLRLKDDGVRFSQDSNSVSISMEEKESIQNLVRKLHHNLVLKSFIKDKYKPVDPEITIAKKLSTGEINTLTNMLSAESQHMACWGSNIVLMKSNSNKDPMESVHEFVLGF